MGFTIMSLWCFTWTNGLDCQVPSKFEEMVVLFWGPTILGKFSGDINPFRVGIEVLCLL